MKFLGRTLFLAGLMSLTACNKQITDYVSATRPGTLVNPPATPTPAPTATGGPSAAVLKISPGHAASSAGGGMSMTATMTPTKKTFSASTDMSAQLSLNHGHATSQ